MANAGRLAGLAALAGAAYLYNQNKDKGTTDSSSTRAARPESTETRNDEGATADKKTKSDVLDAITAPKEKSNDAAGNQGVLSSKSDKPTSVSAPKSVSKPTSVSAPKSVSKPTASSSKPTTSSTVSEADTSRGTRSAEAKNPNYSNEGRPGVAPDMRGKLKTETTTPAQPTARRETYKGLDGKIHYKEPSGPSASQMASDAISSGAKKVGSGIADYVKNFETPAERRAREAKEAKNKPASVAPTRNYNEDALSSGFVMKRGGAVKKMASGGMTASRRADGIATKGKTRCRMY